MRCATLAVIIGFGLLPVAAPGLSWQTAQFTFTPESPLVDERFQVTLDGLKPGQDITIRVDGNRGVWHSHATIRADDRGRVEVPDPMKLIWSATGERPATPVPAPPTGQPWIFTAEADGRVMAEVAGLCRSDAHRRAGHLARRRVGAASRCHLPCGVPGRRRERPEQRRVAGTQR
jgi:hypothetical protein